MADNATFNGDRIMGLGLSIDGKSWKDISTELEKFHKEWIDFLDENSDADGQITVELQWRRKMPVHAMHAFVEGDPDTEFHIFDSSPGAHIVRGKDGEQVFLAKSLLTYKGDGKYEMPEWLAIEKELI